MNFGIYLCSMAGIYIHIPFCKQKCHYCNFFSVASLKHREAFLEVLLKEIELQKDYLEGQEIRTVYFGGGTPSLLSSGEIQKIFDRLNRFFRIHPEAEITLEANPDDLDKNKLQEIKHLPVNRFSMGVQSFFDEDLHYLNRVHDAGQAERSIKLAQDTGFSNITIDLIYGIPSLTNEKWITNLEKFFSLNLPHLSAYSLTVEDKTALRTLINKKKLPDVKEEESIEHFKILLNQMEAHSYVHYEISNFAREGYYSKHNSLYWMGGHYLGLGPSAHSYNGESRQWNHASMHKYLSLADYQETHFEKEILTTAQKFNEYVMTSLRTSWGCDLEHIENVFGRQAAGQCLQDAAAFLADNSLYKENNKLYLTEKGKLLADGIASGLFTEE
ncbi:MAG: radical SAM family heme chaperone HemW [Bacteroidota bacterium]|nr:radical SAM family heme chaperone HemW [Bacteroidota bacterium]